MFLEEKISGKKKEEVLLGLAKKGKTP